MYEEGRNGGSGRRRHLPLTVQRQRRHVDLLAMLVPYPGCEHAVFTIREGFLCHEPENQVRLGMSPP